MVLDKAGIGLMPFKGTSPVYFSIRWEDHLSLDGSRSWYCPTHTLQGSTEQGEKVLKMVDHYMKL